jgi:integrase/recombinase XerD
LKKEDVDNYIFSLYKSKFSWSYKESQIKTIEYWFEFNNNPIHFARQRKPKPIIKQTLTESEITKILFCCKNIREKSIIATLAYSGIRPKELTTLKLQDIDFGSNEIKIKQGKGLKDSVIYISSSCVKLLIEYITKYPRNQQDLLFKTSDGLRAFNTECLRKLIKQLSKKSQIYKRVYPYIFRHSLATTMINRGADILTVMKQLRHENLETTMLYIHSFGYSPKNEYEKFAPSYL